MGISLLQHSHLYCSGPVQRMIYQKIIPLRGISISFLWLRAISAQIYIGMVKQSCITNLKKAHHTWKGGAICGCGLLWTEVCKDMVEEGSGILYISVQFVWPKHVTDITRQPINEDNTARLYENSEVSICKPLLSKQINHRELAQSFTMIHTLTHTDRAELKA